MTTTATPAADAGLPKPTTSSTTRRAILRAGASIAAASAVMAAPLLAAPVADPLVLLYEEWKAVRNRWTYLAYQPDGGNYDTPEMLALVDRRYALELEMIQRIETTPATMASVAAAAHILWTDCGPTALKSRPEYLVEAQQPEARIIAALWRGGTGRGGYPDQDEPQYA